MGYLKNAPTTAKGKKNMGGLRKEIIIIEHDDVLEMPGTNTNETIYLDDIKLVPGARGHVLKQVHGGDKTGFLKAVDQGQTEGGSVAVNVEYQISGNEESHVHFYNMMVRDVDTLQLVQDGQGRWRLAGEKGLPLMRVSGGLEMGVGENNAGFSGGSYKFKCSQPGYPPQYSGDVKKLLLEVPLAQSVSTITTTDATLIWNDLEDTTITDFQVEIATDALFNAIVQTQDVSANTLAATGLTTATLYYYRVASKSSTGTVGLPSNVVKFQTS